MGKNLENFLQRAESPVRQKNSSHRRSRKQESSLANRLNGRVTPGSGNKLTKGDVRITGVLRIEAKTTKHKSFSVTLDMLHKIEEAALSTGEVPAMVIEFNDGEGRVLGEVAVVPTYVLNSILASKEL
jgi:hypothetical protein